MKPIQVVVQTFLTITCLLALGVRWGTAQTKDRISEDSVLLKGQLSEVVVNAFEQTKKLSDQPAAISFISAKAFNRYNSLNIVSAMNAVPGVRMDQRSPGSVRLNIRGSSLRSPFGVRNVKVYYNGMPLTDPGGNTYLNQLGFDDYGSIEIIKGPSGSLYGAGTGGVVVIRSPLFAQLGPTENSVGINLGTGSFGLKKGAVSLTWGGKKSGNEWRYSDIQKEGYRNHTRLRHQVASYSTRLKLNHKETLDAFFHYTNLYYQTPGALTKTEYDQHPEWARTASGTQPSAEESKAAVHQKAFFAGIKHTYYFRPGFQNTTVLYGSYTDFTNPTTRNYELRKEPHFGGRTVFQYHREGEKIQSRYWLGAEVQQGYFSQKDFGNDHGRPDTLQIIDRTNEFDALLFAQAEWRFLHGWDVSAAFSLNHQQLQFTNLYPGRAATFNKKYPLIAAPRIALSKKIAPDILLYLNVSKGFSPPTVAEFLPSTNVLNKNLHAEQGINYELGSKGHFIKHRLYYEASAFVMHLTQSISQRRDSSGADYFVNAGGAWQKGLEAFLSYDLYENQNSFLRSIQAWLSQTFFDFRYKDYFSDGKDFSGKKFPGTAPYTLAAGIDIQTGVDLAAHVTFQHTSKMPLNDANDVYASSYSLLGLQLAYHKKIGKHMICELSAGGNNLLNEKYSLGDDVNAFGGRYYNAAPPMNFYTNVSFKYILNK